MRTVIEVWASALWRSNPVCAAVKTKWGNRSWLRFGFLVQSVSCGKFQFIKKKKKIHSDLEFLLLWNFQFFFSFPPKISFLLWLRISIFLWERKPLCFGGLLATILTHCLTVLRGADLHFYSICSTRSSFCFPVSRALCRALHILCNSK